MCPTLQRAVHLAAVVAALVATAAAVPPARLDAATNPIATPVGMVRFYLHALGTGQCDLAYKFAGRGSRSLGAFRRDCRTIRRITIKRLQDPGYRLRPQTAAYACLAVRYTVYRRSGSAISYGGWYLMERTLGPAWSIVYSRSHVTDGGNAVLLTRAQCASHLPSYVHPGAGTAISGSAFLSASAGWIALSTSGSYLANGSCSHGIGMNCESASTTVYRTEDAGHHWRSLLHVTTAIGPAVWIRLFNQKVALVAATVGPLKATANYRYTSALFSTHDGGRHWQRSSLPVNYSTEPGALSFPDPRHGWLWYGGGAAGSMAVYIFRTTDGGRRWRRVVCTAFENPMPGFKCPHASGISLGGDKEYLTFRNASDGWLTAYEATGIPDIYYTADGGVSWRRQKVGLPSDVTPPTPKSSIFPSDRLLQPSFYGQTGLLPEIVGFYRSNPPANRSRLYVFRSTDGGRTWPTVLGTPVSGDVAFWQELDDRHWVFVTASPSGYPQTIWETGNGGASWTQHALHSPAGLALVGLELIDARDGWAIGRKPADAQVSRFGTVPLRTRDGGVHWSPAGLP